MDYGRSRDSDASPLQRKLYRLLEPAGNMAQTTADDSGSSPSTAELRLSRVLDVALVALIVASSAAVVLSNTARSVDRIGLELTQDRVSDDAKLVS